MDDKDLRVMLVEHFSRGELLDLYFDLGGDYEDLEKERKNDIVRELIIFCRRRGRLQQLLSKCEEIRTSIKWTGDTTHYREQLEPKKLITVVIADDHDLVRQGIRAELEKNYEDIKVIGEASNGKEAIGLVEKLKPDVVVLDIFMPRLDGAEAAEYILSLGIPTQILMLTQDTNPQTVQQLLNKGVKGYLVKSSLKEELPLAIRFVSQGQVYLSPSINMSVLEALATSQSKEPSETVANLLNLREREVLKLISEGYSNKDIAEALMIRVKTVEKHRANLMSKLNVHDLPSLMRKAVKHKLIFQDT